MATGWGLGLLTFVVVAALGNDLMLRVELAALAGSLASALWMAVNLARQLRAIEGAQAAPVGSRRIVAPAAVAAPLDPARAETGPGSWAGAGWSRRSGTGTKRSTTGS